MGIVDSNLVCLVMANLQRVPVHVDSWDSCFFTYNLEICEEHTWSTVHCGFTFSHNFHFLCNVLWCWKLLQCQSRFKSVKNKLKISHECACCNNLHFYVLFKLRPFFPLTIDWVANCPKRFWTRRQLLPGIYRTGQLLMLCMVQMARIDWERIKWPRLCNYCMHKALKVFKSCWELNECDEEMQTDSSEFPGRKAGYLSMCKTASSHFDFL